MNQAAADPAGPTGAVMLVGFMGSGKSRVAVELARRLGRPSADVDAMVEWAEGRPIERVFAEGGEARFRQAELDALGRIDPGPGPVVAAGGGLFARLEARRWVRLHGLAVWIDVPLAVCRRRVGEGASRPLWGAAGGDPLALRALYERRRAVYALADLRVAAGDLGSGQVAELAALRLAGDRIRELLD